MVQIRWKLHLHLPRTTLELQPKYRKIILNSQLETSWRETLKSTIYRRGQ